MKDEETERRCNHEHERGQKHEYRHGRGSEHQMGTREGDLSRGPAARVVRRAAGWLARPGVSDITYSAVAVLLALVIGAVLIAASGYSVVDAYANLFDGAFGSIYNLANTLMMATPLLFTGLSVAVAFQCGLFNVGAEGQLYVGGLASAVVVLALGPAVPGVVRVLLALVAGALAGRRARCRAGLHEGEAGGARGYHHDNAQLRGYSSHHVPCKDIPQGARAGGPDAPPAGGSKAPGAHPRHAGIVGHRPGCGSRDGRRLHPQTHVGGVRIQAVGRNAAAAEYAGVNVPGRIVLTMVMSGAIAGLAGSSVVMGTLYRFITNFSPGYGFTGIAVAVLARNKPWGVLPAALLFGMLQSGGMSMQLFARIPADLMTLVQGIVILFVAAPALASMFLARSRAGAGTGGRG